MPTYCAVASTAQSAMYGAVCRVALAALLASLPAFAAMPAAADTAPVHGLWVWKGPSILAEARGADALLQFCRAQGINEVYVSVSAHGDLSGLNQFSGVIERLHGASIRVEALISSTDADEAGKHCDKLLDHARQIVQFNRSHPATHFDGIHLDIEPQQRPENKGPGNLGFLPGLTDAYRAVRAVAEGAQMSVNRSEEHTSELQ